MWCRLPASLIRDRFTPIASMGPLTRFPKNGFHGGTVQKRDEIAIIGSAKQSAQDASYETQPQVSGVVSFRLSRYKR
jgi:hypothetical protein